MTEPSKTPRTDALMVNETCNSGHTPRSLIDKLAALSRTLEVSLSDGMPKWRDADSDPPADAQQVLAGWFGPSCVEGMETLIYHAADAPDSREAWQDVHGEDRDPPTHWTIVKAPK